MAQFEEEDNETPAQEDLSAVNEGTRYAIANREAVARRRRIEEVVESKRSRLAVKDYDFDLDD